MSLKVEETTPDQALDEYLDTIYIQSHSKYSVAGYNCALRGGRKTKNAFRVFLQEKYNCDELQLVYRITNKELNVYKVLNGYVIWLDKNGLKPKTIRFWFSCAKNYLAFLDVEVYSERCKQLVKLPKIRRIKKDAVTKEILVKLLHNVNPKLQCAILVAISSGMRVGEISGLKLSDIEIHSDPVKINIRAETTKTREDRETFISKEASETLKDYLAQNFGWKEDSPNKNLQELRIFGRTNKIRNKKDSRLPNTEEQKSEAILLQRALIRKIVKVPDLNKLNRNGRRLIHFHAFREYFYSVVSNVSGPNFAHALMGHHDYLDTYYVLSDRQQAQLFKKAEPYLTISDYSKIEKSLERIQEKQAVFDDKYSKLEAFLSKVDQTKLLKLIEHVS